MATWSPAMSTRWACSSGVTTTPSGRPAGSRFHRRLRRQMASKGSIAVDGVSLTLVDVEPTRFSVALIPHTLAHTTLGRCGQAAE